MTRILMGWWIAIAALSMLFIGMGVGLFYPEQIYVDLWVYIFIMAALLFCIFAVFRWGKTKV